MPTEDDQDEKNQADDQAQDDDQEQDQNDDDENPSAQTDAEPETIEVPIEMKDKMLDLHRLAGEIFGMFTAGDDNVVDRYKKFDMK
jgi:hypothetical protein